MSNYHEVLGSFSYLGWLFQVHGEVIINLSALNFSEPELLVETVDAAWFCTVQESWSRWFLTVELCFVSSDLRSDPVLWGCCVVKGHFCVPLQFFVDVLVCGWADADEAVAVFQDHTSSSTSVHSSLAALSVLKNLLLFIKVLFSLVWNYLWGESTP